MFVFAKKYNELLEKYEKQKLQITEISANYDSGLKVLNQKLLNVKELLQNGTDKIKRISSENTNLVQELSDLKNALTETRDKLSKEEEKTQKLGWDKSFLTNKISNLEEEKNDVVAKIAEYEKEKTELYKLYLKEIEKTKKYGQQEKGLVQELSDLKNGLTETRNKLSKEEEKTQKLGWDKSFLTNKVSKLEEEKKQLKKAIENITKKLLEKDKKVCTLDKEKNDMVAKITEYEKENNNLYNFYLEETEKNNKYSQREKNLVQELSKIKSEKSELSEKLNIVVKNHEELINKIESSATNYENLINILKQENLELKDMSQKTEDKFLNEEKKIYNLNCEKNEAVYKSLELEKENAELNKKINELMKKDESENQRFESEIKILKEENSKLYKFYLEEIEKSNKYSQFEKDLVQELSKIKPKKSEPTYKSLELEEENIEAENQEAEPELEVLREMEKEQIKTIPSKNIELYNEFKDNLMEAVKQFKPIDVKEIYKFAQEKKILKNDEKKLFNNINVRMKLNMAIHPSSLQELTELYKKIVDLGYIDETKENSNQSELKDFRAMEEENGKGIENLETAKVEIDLDLRKLSVEHWFKLSEIYNEDKDFDPWLRRFIYSLANYKKKNGILTEKQLEVIENKFVELGESLAKLSKFISKHEEDKIAEPVPKKPLSVREILESMRAKEEPKVEELQPIEEPKIVPEEITFDNLLKRGLNQGYIESEELMKVDYDKETLIVDYYDALEELEARGIKINY